MKFKMNGSKGFSLVELMIVVGIIGILASLALPRLQVFMAKARESEARTSLSAVKTLIETYHVDNNTYVGATLDVAVGVAAVPGTNNAIGLRAPALRFHTLSMPVAGTATEYTARAASGADALCTGSLPRNHDVTQATAVTSPATQPTCN